MCGIIFTSKCLSEDSTDKSCNLKFVNYYLSFRGPDNTTLVNTRGFSIVHNHLHITGEKITQPFEKDGIYRSIGLVAITVLVVKILGFLKEGPLP